MANFVLVHGGAHGGWCFQPLARVLRDNGHEVYTPTLTGLGERAHLFRADVDLDCHIDDVVAVLRYEDLRDAILVGHSYGGAVITGAADRAPDRVAHRVYLDSMNPRTASRWWTSRAPSWRRHNWTAGRSTAFEMCLFPSDETLPYYGVVDPETLEWMRERLTPHPVRCFQQPLTLTNPAALQSIPQSHISTTMFLSLRNVDRIREKADGRVWDIDTGHDLMITEPHKVAEYLDRVAALTAG